MLLWRAVPSNVVEIMAYCSVTIFLIVANYSMKIAFWRRNKICIVHKDRTGEVIPSPYAVLNEGSR
jgi:hypothetical protein